MVSLFSANCILPCSRIFFDVYSRPPFLYSWLSKQGVYDYFFDLFRTPKFLGFVYLSQNEQDGTVSIQGACLGVVSDYFKIKKYRIAELFVEKHSQNSGIGTKIIFEAEKYLKGIGIAAIELSTDKILPGIEFYKNCGFDLCENTVNMIKIVR